MNMTDLVYSAFALVMARELLSVYFLFMCVMRQSTCVAKPSCTGTGTGTVFSNNMHFSLLVQTVVCLGR